MLRVGDKLPDFVLPAVVGPGDVSRVVTTASFSGKWLVLLYWPMDFGAVCPSEVEELARLARVLGDPRVQILGAGTDLGRLRELGGVPFPIVADVKQELARALGLAGRAGGCALRATYLADPLRIVRWMSTEDLSVAHRLGDVVGALQTLRAPTPQGAPGLEPRGGHGDHGRSLIRMCAWCKKVHAESGEWQAVEHYMNARTGEEFTHGICPGCFDMHIPAGAR
jgi:peroxiredoxin (alkyl hydroperoxide reductase subunit C)